MPKQAAELKEGPLRTTQAFLAWTELCHIYAGSTQIWNEPLKYEFGLSGLRWIHLTIFAISCPRWALLSMG